LGVSLYLEIPLKSKLRILYENLKMGYHLKHSKTVESNTNLEVKKVEIEAPVDYRVLLIKSCI